MESVVVTTSVHRFLRWLTLVLVAILPFQKRYSSALKHLSYSLAPTDLTLPAFFSKKLYFYLSDFLIFSIVLLCLYRFRGQLKALFFSGPCRFLVGFLAVAFLSISVSITSDYPLQYYRLFQLSLVIAFFCSLRFFLQSTDKKTLLVQIFWVLMVVSFFECFIAIAQYFLQHPIGLKSLGEVNTRVFNFDMEGGRRWVFDNLSGFVSGNSKLYRSSGTFTHPNILGGFLFASLLSTYYLTLVEENKRVRALLHSAIVLQIFTLAITFSRAAIIATALSTCVWVGLSLFKRSFNRRQLMILCTVILSAAGSLFLLYDQFFARGGIVNYNEVTTGADTERIVYQKMAWKMFKDHPLLGCGYNNFQILSPGYAPQETTTVFFAKVHNIYLLILAETGLFGLCAFLFFLFSLTKTAFKATDDVPTRLLLALFLGFLFIGGCDYYFLETQHGRLLFFTFAGLLASSKSYK